MPLAGQAKTDYQRDYMRRRRSNARSNEKRDNKAEIVRPKHNRTVRPKTGLVRPAGISANQWAYMQYKAEEKKRVDKAEDAAGLVRKP